MPNFKTRGRSWELTVDQKGQMVTMGISTIDPTWRFTDANGHEHYYEGPEYPTLRHVIDASHWCDGHEGPYNHDPHLAIDEAHYECLQCGEVVEPALYPPDHQEWMPGMIDARLSAWRSDGATVEMILTPDDLDLVERAMRVGEAYCDGVVQRLLDNAPPEQIRSVQFASR